MMIEPTLLEQFKQELKLWKQKLEKLQSESVYLKTTIAERVSPDIDEDTLSKAENLHNQLMQKDEIITLLKMDVITFRNVLDDGAIKDGQMNKFLLMEKKLQSEIETLELKFNQLKSEFNQQLPDKL